MTTINDTFSEAYVLFSEVDLSKELTEEKYLVSDFMNKVESLFHLIVWEQLGKDVAEYICPVVTVSVDASKVTSRKIKKETLIKGLSPNVHISTSFSKVNPRMFPYIPNEVKERLTPILDLNLSEVQTHYEELVQLNEMYYLYLAREGAKKVLDHISKRLEEETGFKDSTLALDHLYDPQLTTEALNGVIYQINEEEVNNPPLKIIL